jgi:hypothetical protein
MNVKAGARGKVTSAENWSRRYAITVRPEDVSRRPRTDAVARLIESVGSEESPALEYVDATVVSGAMLALAEIDAFA